MFDDSKEFLGFFKNSCFQRNYGQENRQTSKYYAQQDVQKYELADGLCLETWPHVADDITK